ncbi:MAG: HAMP domain-containing protein, partial [Woeseiaceae bacterium]
MNKYSFPIRLKVLVAVLVILMLVVGVITATMANLFHQDKTAYVRDSSVVKTLNMRAEIETILASHLSAAGVLAEVLLAEYMQPAARERLVKPIFVAYPGLLALVTTGAGGEPLSLYNSAGLRDAGIEPDELHKLPSLTTPREEGTVRVRGIHNDSGTGAVTLTLGRRLPGEEKESPVVAIISPADISKVLSRGRPFDSVLVDPDWQPVVAIGDTDNAVAWARLALESFEGVGTSGGFEYSADGHDYIAAVAKSSIGDLTIVTRISATAAYMTASQLLDDLVFVGLVIILVAAICGDIASRRITRPLERLSNAVRKIAKGDFDVNVAIKSSDEIGELSTSFNDMAAELKEREASLKKAQHALIQSEKMAAVGTLSAGLAHEVKNPLSAVLGYAQLSKRKLTDPDALKGYLDTIENETRRCNEIIGNLMQFSR